MRHAINVALALAVVLALSAGCKQDKASPSGQPDSPAPAATDKTTPPATADTPTTSPDPAAPAATPATPPAASPPATADAHAGHRHEPSDPYYCPMHPEETSKEAGAKCPVCQMAMERRKK